MSRPRKFDEDDVVERAMEEFWTNGYAATSPARLAEATGVAKGSLYNAFSSKRALFERCLDKYQQQIAKLAEGLMGHPGSTRECLRDALRAVVDSDLAQARRRGCLIGNTAVELAGNDPGRCRTNRPLGSPDASNAASARATSARTSTPRPLPSTWRRRLPVFASWPSRTKPNHSTE